MVDAHGAWASVGKSVTEVQVAGRAAWMLTEHLGRLDVPADHPVVRLLPAYDTYLLGYRTRDLVLAPEHGRRVHPGGGVIRRAVLVDGRVAGTWSSMRRPEGMQITVEPFEHLRPDVCAGLEAEVADLGWFLGRAGHLRVVAETPRP